jgi:hypothetical protein
MQAVKRIVTGIWYSGQPIDLPRTIPVFVWRHWPVTDGYRTNETARLHAKSTGLFRPGDMEPDHGLDL